MAWSSTLSCTCISEESSEQGSAEASGASKVTKDQLDQLQVNEKIMAGQSQTQALVMVV